MAKKIQKKVDFIGIGAFKCATTWTFKCLVEHPIICGSSRKEVRFFDHPYRYKRGVRHYMSFFDKCSKDNIIGEFSPSYIFYPEAPKLIYKHFPKVKLIANLRNPIERAYSNYRSSVYTKGRLSIYKSFEEAAIKMPSLLKKGLYYKQLKRYYELFPKENIHIVIYEDIKKNPIRCIQEIYKFLGAEPYSFIPPSAKERVNRSDGKKGTRRAKHKIPLIAPIVYHTANFLHQREKTYSFFDNLGLRDFGEALMGLNRKKNITVTDRDKKSVPPMSQKTRKKLQNIYKKDIKNLEQLMEKDLSSWN